MLGFARAAGIVNQVAEEVQHLVVHADRTAVQLLAQVLEEVLCKNSRRTHTFVRHTALDVSVD